jgi:hypothetical protein
MMNCGTSRSVHEHHGISLFLKSGAQSQSIDHFERFVDRHSESKRIPLSDFNIVLLRERRPELVDKKISGQEYLGVRCKMEGVYEFLEREDSEDK